MRDSFKKEVKKGRELLDDSCPNPETYWRGISRNVNGENIYVNDIVIRKKDRYTFMTGTHEDLNAQLAHCFLIRTTTFG